MTRPRARWWSVADAITGFMQSARSWQVSICLSVCQVSVKHCAVFIRCWQTDRYVMLYTVVMRRSLSYIFHRFCLCYLYYFYYSLGALARESVLLDIGTGALLTCPTCPLDDMYELLSKLPESAAYTCTKCTERHPAEWRTALERQLQGCVHHVLTALLNSRTSSHLLRYKQVWLFSSSCFHQTLQVLLWTGRVKTGSFRSSSSAKLNSGFWCRRWNPRSWTQRQRRASHPANNWRVQILPSWQRSPQQPPVNPPSTWNLLRKRRIRAVTVQW